MKSDSDIMAGSTSMQREAKIDESLIEVLEAESFMSIHDQHGVESLGDFKSENRCLRQERVLEALYLGLEHFEDGFRSSHGGAE